jgi:hypothetical protein
MLPNGTLNQDWLCWREPAVIYPTNRGREQNRTTVGFVREYNIVVSPAGLGTKVDCAGEGQQQFTLLELEVEIVAEDFRGRGFGVRRCV